MFVRRTCVADSSATGADRVFHQNTSVSRIEPPLLVVNRCYPGFGGAGALGMDATEATKTRAFSPSVLKRAEGVLLLGSRLQKRAKLSTAAFATRGSSVSHVAILAKKRSSIVQLGSRQHSYRRHRYSATVRNRENSFRITPRRDLARAQLLQDQPVLSPLASNSSEEQRCGESAPSPRRPPRCRRR